MPEDLKVQNKVIDAFFNDLLIDHNKKQEWKKIEPDRRI